MAAAWLLLAFDLVLLAFFVFVAAALDFALVEAFFFVDAFVEFAFFGVLRPDFADAADFARALALEGFFAGVLVFVFDFTEFDAFFLVLRAFDPAVEFDLRLARLDCFRLAGFFEDLVLLVFVAFFAVIVVTLFLGRCMIQTL